MKQKIKSNPFERSQPLTNDFFDIPLLGQVRAGNHHPGYNGAARDYDLGDLVLNFRQNQQHSVILEVLDNAMENAGIIKGDYLTVDLDARLKDGDIAVVKLGERFFIRKFYHQDRRIRLETAANTPTTLIVETNTPGFKIIGKVRAMTRRF